MGYKGAERAFSAACVTIRPQRWLSPVGAVQMRQSEIQGERLHLLRRFLALLALGAFLVPMILPDRTQAARVQQDPKQDPKQDKKDAKQENKEPAPIKQDSKQDTKFTAEQVVE